MHQLPPALAPLGAYRQFMCYVLTPSETKPGKMDKLPVSPHTGRVVTAHDSANWTDATTACRCAAEWGAAYGVAFVFTEKDPFFFVDLDDHFDPATQQWTPLAQMLVQGFAGAAMELSQSGRGLHIIGTGQAPPHGKKNEPLRLEFYTERRFIALTGTMAQGDASLDCTANLHYITEHFFPPNAGSANGDWSLSTEPVPEWCGPTDDADLIRRALNSRSAASAFGAGASFSDLWTANHDMLSKAFPDAARVFNASAADAALVAHLSFWTGRHGERIERLMQQSALVREKWLRDDYLPRTIAEILARPGEVLQDTPPEPPAVLIAATGAPNQTAVTGNTFLSPEEQRNTFNGCVYVLNQNRILVPGGHLLKKEQFKVTYGGYTFAMDTLNERTTRDAWEAFTESQALRAPRAHSTCFMPTRPPGEIINDAGRSRVNTWWPANVVRKTGDVLPFLRHLEKMLPDERDRTIVLSYMAACVQYQGIKFQWAPVLQGSEGNGKSTLSACVAMAVGQHYTHWIKADDLASPFNGWIEDKTFVAVEELKSRDHAEEAIENLHVLITGGMGIQLQRKGIDQESKSIVANFLCTTNHRGAVRKTPDNARRFGMFFMAQQTKADIDRDGMGGSYFPELQGWLRKDGFAIVSELLHTYPIPDEFNPATTLVRAPHTSTTDSAIIESRGAIEQHIHEAVATDTPGFMGGWISSGFLDRLIGDTLRMGNKITLQRRRQMLLQMGYVLHPGLPEGRVNNAVQPDGKRVQLFVLAGSPQSRIVGGAEIAKAYTAAQTISTFKV